MSFSRGFTLIEVLATAFILAVVVVGITGLAMVSTRSAIESERKNVAQAIANEEIEVARTYSYDQIEYVDISPQGKIKREKIVKRNDQDYTVASIITLKDDPANGTLPEGTPLTAENADFKQLSVKVSWTRISGKSPSTTSSTVVAATFFARMAESDACIPSTITCSNPNSCTPGTPASCPDEKGDYTLDCPVIGVCAGDEPFVACPASGKCSDIGQEPGNGQPPNDGQPPEDDQPPGDGQPPGNGDGDGVPDQCEDISAAFTPTKEVCDLSLQPGGACNDRVDNDDDKGADLGFDVFPTDAQCQAALQRTINKFDDDGDGQTDEPDETDIVEPAGPCLRGQCPNVQLWRRIGPVSASAQCSLIGGCGTTKYFYRSCQTECNDGVNNDGVQGADVADDDCWVVPLNGGPKRYNPSHASEGNATAQCSDGADNDGDGQTDLGDAGCESALDDDEACPDNKENKCQEKHDCPELSTCLPPPDGQAGGAKPACPVNQPKCKGGNCYECVVNGAERCPQIVATDPDRGLFVPSWCGINGNVCACRAGKCVQCAKDHAKDEKYCLNKDRPFCASGRCVECLSNNDCKDPAKSHCRTAAKPPGLRYTCQDECNDGRDNDFDGTIDANDQGCQVGNKEALAGLPGRRPQCSDEQDNDGDGRRDFNAPPGFLPDPGCTDAIDDNEQDPLPPGQPRPQCSDQKDNDGDGKVDVNGFVNFPPDPGCIDGADNDEQDPLPLPSPSAAF